MSFIRLDVDARRASAKAVQVRLKPSVRKLRSVLAFSRGGTVKRSVLTYRVKRGTRRTIYLAWINYPGRRTLAVDAARYERARGAVVAYWTRRLQEGTQITVPERRVNDAYRNLLIQNLLLTWRYSIGNPYEQFSFPEGVDVAEVMGELGYAGVARSIMRTSLTRKDEPYPNWKWANGSSGPRSTTASPATVTTSTARRRCCAATSTSSVARSAPAAPASSAGSGTPRTSGRGARAALPGNRLAGPPGDGPCLVGDGNAELGRRCAALAKRLETGLRRAVASSQRRLGDGSLFIPARLLDREPAYASLTQARLGSYWNLVMPYALASGSSLPTARRRPARSSTCSATDRACSASSARAPMRSTSSRSFRSPAPIRSTGSTSPGSWRTPTQPTSSCSASTARWPWQ